MLHFGRNNDVCKTCIPLQVLKFTIIITIGFLIGHYATNYVEQPYSTRLLLESNHTKNTNIIIVKMDTMEKDISSIRNDITSIKNKIFNNHDEEE